MVLPVRTGMVVDSNYVVIDGCCGCKGNGIGFEMALSCSR